MKRQSNLAGKFSVDRMMRNVALSLVRDFQDNLLDPTFCSEFQSMLRLDGEVDRGLCPAPTSEMSVAEFKATYQIQSVFKRYRFQKDAYSDEELTIKAIDGFRDTQSRIANLNLDTLDTSSKCVLDRAAIYIARVLGKYSDEEHRNLSRFGRKASVGIPARFACEAARWELPISGSPEQIAWFDSEMSKIDCVQEYWIDQLDRDPSRSVYQETSSLTLSLVPKTFKSLRAIMPNTTIGSYMSYGLGEMIRKRLKREGYDIRSLQKRHRYLASLASVNNLYVTADLSSASDSISVALVERLFPPDWLEILNQSRIGTVCLPDGSSVESKTFCTMGIGYTFPLQTLVFLALLKAIESTLYNRLDRRLISVYGDDMIYARRMHSEVVGYFQKFGFVINLDKTYHDGHFRESCGGDYYHGVDVRPFQPQNGSASVGKTTYEAILYKIVNGLLARWSEYEIGRTLNFLVIEIESVAGAVKRVPQDHGDDSGIKCPTLTFWDFLKRAKCAHLKHVGHGAYRFPYLRFVPEDRKEMRHGPYLWAALRGPTLPVFDYSVGMDFQGDRHPILVMINDACGVTESVSPLHCKDDTPIVTFRSKLSGRRLRRQSTYVAVSHTGRYRRQSGVSCFGTRR